MPNSSEIFVEAMVRAAIKRERDLCRRDLCMYCAGRATGYNLIAEGPTEAGCYVHKALPGGPSYQECPGGATAQRGVLCLASAIYARERFDRPEESATPEPAPIPMILWCPACGLQHVDRPQMEKEWYNPPHRSHECQGCGFVWRQADIPTTGVQEITTSGIRDSPRPIHGSPKWILPWTAPPLNEWSICGMNHYQHGSSRHLWIAMMKAGRVIKAEGPSEVAVFLELGRRAEEMNRTIAAEKETL